MFRVKSNQERVIHRLKIAKGHLETVLKMAQDHEYCIDVLHQSQAVQKALSEIDNLILENHLKTCVLEKIKKGDHELAIKEVMEIYKKSKSS